MRKTTCVGLILFNIHDLTNIFLMPDILWFAITARLLLVMPIVLAIVWNIKRMSATFRELAALSLVTGAFLTEVILLWMTQAPLGAYAFSELGLTLVYGNMLLALRYRHAVLFTAISFSFAVLAVCLKPLPDDALRFAFVVQIAMACIISLYANYKTERHRCLDYVVAHLAGVRAERSEHAKREYQDQSRTDALTGLPNRRLLDERLKEWLSEERSAAVMMIDIDHFKLFNDTFGHPTGDDCLRSIGAVLAALQTSDTLCARFGGEEFTIMVRDADEMGAARLANTLVKAIEALGIIHPARSDGIGVVTASVGVVFRAAHGVANPQDIVAAADAALYRAKLNGRNCYAIGDLQHLSSKAVA